MDLSIGVRGQLWRRVTRSTDNCERRGRSLSVTSKSYLLVLLME